MGMREMMKSTLAAVLAVGLCMSATGGLQPVHAKELEEVYTSLDRYMIFQGYSKYVCEDGSYFYYQLKKQKLSISQWESNESDTLVIPDSIGDKPVSKVYIEDELEAKNIVLEDGIKSFDHYRYRDGMFDTYDLKCEIETITLGKSFEGTPLCNGVCDGAPFENLKEIKVSSENKNICTIDGVLFTKNRKKLLLYPSNKNASKYTVPKKTQVIESGAFNGADKLRKVVISSKVKKLKAYAFEYCVNLKELVFKSKNTKIAGPYNTLVHSDRLFGRRGDDDEIKKMTIKAPKGSPAVNIAEEYKKYKKIKFVTIKG